MTKRLLGDDPNPSGLCMCGCGLPAPLAKQSYGRSGIIRGQPVRFIQGHQRRQYLNEYQIEDRGYKTPCHIWQRGLSSGGYGLKPVNNTSVCAHRWYYEQKYGPISPGLELDHLCLVIECVNPDHMEPVEPEVNQARSMAPNMVTHREGVCRRGHPMTLENAPLERDGRRRCLACRALNQKRRKGEVTPHA